MMMERVKAAAGVVGLVSLLGVLLAGSRAMGQSYFLDWADQFGTARWDETTGLAAIGPGAPGGGAGVYAAGFLNDFASDTVGFVARYDDAGALLWRRELGVAFTKCLGVAADADANVYAAGLTRGLFEPATTSAAFLVKLDPDGELLWHALVDGDNSEAAWGVAVSGDGQTVIAGRSNSDLIGGRFAGGVIVARFGADGQQLWLRQFGGSEFAGAAGVALDAGGNAVVVGSQPAPSPDTLDGFVARLDAAGEILWQHAIATDRSDEVLAVTVDADGHALVAGRTLGDLAGPSLGGADALLVKLDADGNRVWVRQFGTPQGEDAQGVAVDAAGNATVTGGTAGSLGGPTTGASDAYVVRFGPDGERLWTRQVGSSEADLARAVAVGEDGTGQEPVYVGGLTLGDLAAPAAGLGDAFVLRYVLVDCYSDFDGSGSLDIFDFLAFLNAFEAGEAAADCDGSGSLDLLDFLCFQNAFDTGCP
ncbi:MAG: GC-type dockerin domain-anchored protein [Phycisphaerales bacterium JB060]